MKQMTLDRARIRRRSAVAFLRLGDGRRHRSAEPLTNCFHPLTAATVERRFVLNSVGMFLI